MVVNDEAGPRWPVTVAQVVAVLVFAGIWVAMLAAMPRGFGWAAVKQHTNVTMPAAALLSLLGALVMVAWKRETTVLSATLAAHAALVIVLAITARLLFPISFPAIAYGPLLVFAVLLLVGLLPLRRHRAALAAGACVGVLFGVTAAVAQLAPAPTTHPQGAAPPAGPKGTLAPARVPVGPAELSVKEPSIALHGTGWSARLRPLLTFHSRSPDGFWTLFASRAHRRGPKRKQRGARITDDGVVARYDYDGRDTLRVSGHPGGVRIASWVQLPEPVYSHLNSYAELRIDGPDLQVAVGSCAPVDVPPSDYPMGRPDRFAYVADRLHLVEASSAEKGPFQSLCEAPLQDPLTLRVLRHGVPILRWTLHDFVAQASRAPSPTAGWGVPQNAIRLMRNRRDGPLTLSLTLAATGVGRGFESVGHRAGIYRSRMNLDVSPPPR